MRIILEDDAFDVRVTAETQSGYYNWHLTVVSRGGTVVREFDVAESLNGAFDLCRRSVMIEAGLGSLVDPKRGS